MELEPSVAKVFAGFLPDEVLVADLVPVLPAQNPVLDGQESDWVHPNLRKAQSVPRNSSAGEVNGLIKFRFANPVTTEVVERYTRKRTAVKLDEVEAPPAVASGEKVTLLLGRPDAPSLRGSISVSRLPPSFGQVALSDPVDRQFLRFCKLSPISLGLALAPHSKPC